MEASLLTPPPTPVIAPTSKPPTISRRDVTETRTKRMSEWTILLLQLFVTLPLYFFSFWFMVELLKAGGDPLVDFIDYLCFRKPGTIKPYSS